jgi:predicted dienelactone hydrolase
MRARTLFLLGALGACTPTGPGTPAIPPSSARAGTDGADGPFGAARVWLLTQARVTERVWLEVHFPADASGNLARDRAPYPTVVLVQGGLVAVERYRWLAQHFATRGYVVVSPAHALDLAIFQPENATASLRALRAATSVPGHTLEGAVSPTGRVVAMGHSLGGVISVWQWIDRGFDGVALLASRPADGSRIDLRPGAPVLSITGSADGLASVESVTRGFSAFSAPRMLAVVDGMNHFDWTDEATAGEMARDRPATRPRERTRIDALRVIDTWLDATLRADPAAARALDVGMFAGVTVTR